MIELARHFMPFREFCFNTGRLGAVDFLDRNLHFSSVAFGSSKKKLQKVWKIYKEIWKMHKKVRKMYKSQKSMNNEQKSMKN